MTFQKKAEHFFEIVDFYYKKDNNGQKNVNYWLKNVNFWIKSLFLTKKMSIFDLKFQFLAKKCQSLTQKCQFCGTRGTEYAFYNANFGIHKWQLLPKEYQFFY